MGVGACGSGDAGDAGYGCGDLLDAGGHLLRGCGHLLDLGGDLSVRQQNLPEVVLGIFCHLEAGGYLLDHMGHRLHGTAHAVLHVMNEFGYPGRGLSGLFG
ncbi:hypothetical protein D3C73_1102360 [compost metagenome]